MVLVAMTLLGGVCSAQVPRVTYNDPIAGFSLTMPEDWELKRQDFGLYAVAIGADSGAPICIHQPVLWLFRCLDTPEKTARGLAQGFATAWGVEPTVRATGKPDEWEVTLAPQDGFGTLQQRFLCRQEKGTSYVIAAFTRPDFAPEAADEVQTALATCRLIDGPPTTVFREPKYNAYRMRLPQGWRWEGDVLFALNVPGYFTWKVQSPDGLSGAFSSPPALFDITQPYMGVESCARDIVLPGLRQILPDAHLDQIHMLTRTANLFCTLLREFGISDTPRIEKGLVDFVGTLAGTTVRVRVTVAPVQLSSSPWLGGRGNWTLFTAGVWGREEHFDRDYEIGRGVMASLVTDPQFRNAQLGAVTDAVLGQDVYGQDGKKRGTTGGSARARDWWGGRWVREYIRD
jgi:hypothetical protein